MDRLFVLGLIIAAAAIVGCSWLCWQLLRQNGRILLRLDELEKRLDQLEFGGPQEAAGLPIGSPAPDFDLPGLDAEHKTLAAFRGKSLLVIFFNPDCRFCRELVPRLAALAVGSPSSESDPRATASPAANGHPLPLIISSGNVEQNRQFFAEHQIGCPVLVQQKTEVSDAYGSNGTPSGYLIDAEGKIASEYALGADMLLALANSPHPQPLSHPMGEGSRGPGEGDRVNRFSNRSLARSKIKRDGLKAGTPAPDFRLPRLDGRGEFSLPDLRGRRVLMVFSSPACAPCNELAPKLEKFHRDQPDLELVMISMGDPGENRAKVKKHRLTFPVALQQGWAISRRYAIFATPAAYLIDPEGIIAHDVAVGTEPILKLLAGITRKKEQIEPTSD